ncbi:4-(cytidine 5'-diphospho)-2-C-methyl-D-erythritol kinase [Phyllobacterium phragmitis]|uniref:4-diphosphocytidyl-2-C-methyl-D-erythritol kinase n=1 Tax=Phyllobacterium phragmitis TaxID=2670329 RepID=A0A2S9IZL7_9HYPH|nr:4-(cytidine 5'-diphospho)-2-C-methyl-D-erythritol kinase [Phyllobacterium phragmitis]PRD45973.1 4-(cytidine 5'-diphospho)-2-C-methyl-D-erythritol kinase [Phyllobacterium phragmitis]
MNRHISPLLPRLSARETISLLAPAKINLALHVTGRRDDGYHLLESLVAFAAFGDQIDVSPARQDHFAVTGPFAYAVPADGANLVMRARDALRTRFPSRARPVDIRLEKKLPIASGIGGGSSDAAAALIALNRLWALDLDMPALCEIGLSLGADLPMCLHGQQTGLPLVARGIGEALDPVSRFPSLPIVLANDGTGLSTPQVFQALLRRDHPPLPSPPAFSVIEEVCAYLQGTRNDLYAASLTLAPGLAGLLDLFVQTGARFTQMSGSGATCFAVFGDNAAAARAAAFLRARHPQWFVVATETRSTSES